MKNRGKWQPSKYIQLGDKLIASRDKDEVNIASRLIADLVADFYYKSLRLHARGRLLDLGCGKVPLYASYKDLVTDNICVDWSNTLHKNDFLDFECDLNQPLPFNDNEFDVIIISDVLEHIAEPDVLFREIARILKKDGKLLLNVPFFYLIHEHPYDFFRYTEFALKRFLAKNDLKLVFFDAIGGSPEVLADILGKHFKYIPLIGNFLVLAIKAIVMLFVRTKLGRQISRETSKYFPLGYVLVAEK